MTVEEEKRLAMVNKVLGPRFGTITEAEAIEIFARKRLEMEALLKRYEEQDRERYELCLARANEKGMDVIDYLRRVEQINVLVDACMTERSEKVGDVVMLRFFDWLEDGDFTQEKDEAMCRKFDEIYAEDCKRKRYSRSYIARSRAGAKEAMERARTVN